MFTQTCPDCNDQAPARFECETCGTEGWVEVEDVPEVVSSVIGDAAYEPGGREEGQRRADEGAGLAAGRIDPRFQEEVNAAAISASRERSVSYEYVSAYHVYAKFSQEVMDYYNELPTGQKKTIIRLAMINAANAGWIEKFFVDVDGDTYELLDVTKRPSANAGNQRVWRINGNAKKPTKVTFKVKQ